MTPGERDDDEMDLINAEFESMVADLNLDQSAPTTYLDDLDALEKSERLELYYPPRVHRGLHGSITHFIDSIRKWWRKPPDQSSDGAVV